MSEYSALVERAHQICSGLRIPRQGEVVVPLELARIVLALAGEIDRLREEVSELRDRVRESR